MSDVYSFGATPARGAQGARSARRRRPIDFERTLEIMSALGEFRPISPDDARRGLEMAQALDGSPVDDRPLGKRDPIQLGATRERFDPMEAGETAMLDIPGTPRLDVDDPQGRRDAALAAMAPISVESGGWGEALAEGLTAYLRGQAGAREFDRAQSERGEEKFRESGRRNAIQAAARMTEASPAMLASALSVGAPEEALQFNLDEGRARREREQKREDALWTLNTIAPRQAEIENEAAVARARALMPIEIETARATYPYRFAPERSGGASNLAPQEQTRITKASEAAESASSLREFAQEFIGLNSRVRTGPGSGALGLGQLFNRERQRMNQLSSNMLLTLDRPGFTSAVSDADREMLRAAVPNTDIDGRVNQAGVAAIVQGAKNVEDRASFLDRYSARGTLQGSEQIWRSYVRANPIFDRLGNVRTDRPGFDEWLAQGTPDMSRALAPASADRGASLGDLVAPNEQRRTPRREPPPSALWTPY